MAKLVTLPRLPRTGRDAATALVLALVVASPAAAATPPTHTVCEPHAWRAAAECE